MRDVAVTGATGFIGRHLVQNLVNQGFRVSAVGRDAAALDSVAGLSRRQTCPDWAVNEAALAEAFAGCELVYHLADDPNRQVKSSGSSRLAIAVANAASMAGCSRIVFSSSIYARSMSVGNHQAYGAGKLAAENVLSSRSNLTTMRLRLPPVYGPGSTGAISQIANFIIRGIPVPFSLASARRDYLWIENLTSLLAVFPSLSEEAFVTLALEPHEPNDGSPVTTRELALILGEVVGRPPRLFPFPPSLVRTLGRMAGPLQSLAAAFEPLEAVPQDGLRQAIGWRPSDDLRSNFAYLTC